MASSSASSDNHGQYLSETSSRSLTNTVTVAHNFEITNYWELDGMGIGEYICSSTFSADGYDWNIRFFPKSMPGKKQHLPLDDGRFTIRCVLTVMTHHTQDVSSVAVPQSNLHNQLVEMMKDEESTDVTFSVGDQQFHAHRCMLAVRSPVFKAELFSDMEENATRHIKIDDMEPAIFGALLRFIYTDDFPNGCGVDKDAPLQHLFVAADRYGLDRLSAMCEGKLCQSIDVHIVASTLALAEQHHCMQLKNACLGFVSSQGVLAQIRETEDFRHLILSCPAILDEIIDKAAVATGRVVKRARRS
ncbi:BTB/POZ and MATH domain-containing protein 2-like [Lolium rigidum]|uniref:BTB/POZ and MATH domain-containing protein 2-like n=1 Tax=Lolium rigidum TaxID=89674 RepID=UPI001F5DA7ED|nr:BTB/POZ and MATH domain-containing protein 2-like [Lolium rigidum]